tara:strand:- start:126 stop:758 length:633 start_codon:yes stop_codon:yes gene_type:complete
MVSPLLPAVPDDDFLGIEVSAGPLPALSEHFNPDRVQAGAGTIFQQELSLLGMKLVDEVKKRTPKSSSRLARSTKFRVRRIRDPFSGDVLFELQIIQDALSVPKARVSQRYFYWYSVHHGLQPAGRLQKVFPPFENLVPWVIRRFGSGPEKEVKRRAKAVAFKIWKEGIPPNNYLVEAMEARRNDIQLAADRIQRDIMIDLTRLPDITVP